MEETKINFVSRQQKQQAFICLQGMFFICHLSYTGHFVNDQVQK